MPAEPRVILLTSNGLRHRYVAREISQRMDLVGIVAESKSSVASTPRAASDEDRLVIEQHLAERDLVERRVLAPEIEPFGRDCMEIPSGGINDLAVFEFVSACNPDFVVVYGTGIIKPPMLEVFQDRLVNIHLGLSPYYRGAGTNFWPLVNREPECVGATIHFVVQQVDAGSILFQVRPSVSADDGAHELGTKALKKAVTALPSILQSRTSQEVPVWRQDLSLGRVYRVRDFTAHAVRRMWQNFDTGMIAEYLENREARRQRFPIYEPVATSQ